MSIGAQVRFPLATLPTPLQEAPRLREALGGAARCPRILLKRDDLTGLALGGNKARKLEFLVADALAQGATWLITTGAVQSNHARMTAAAARLAGLGCSLVLTSHGDDTAVRGNLLLDRLLRAEVHFAPIGDSSIAAGDIVGATMSRVANELRDRGERPYIIPAGGSNAVGVLGYVAATLELVGQLFEAGEAPSRLYCASGSRGTQAGLVLGAKLYGAPYQCVGIAVSPGGSPERLARGAELANEAADRLGVSVHVDPNEMQADEGYVGEGYGIPTAACLEAMHLLAEHEAVILDPVYTGKAMAGLIDHIRRGRIAPTETVVFLHTGGVPAIFAHGEALL